MGFVKNSGSRSVFAALAAGLFFSLVLTAVPAHGWPIGDGSIENPYHVETAEQLDQIRTEPGSYFVQAGNIDLWDLDGDWVPVGCPESPFTGGYDGGGHEITGLYIYQPSGEYTGLFGYIRDAELANIQLQVDYVEGWHYVGGLVGWNEGGAITGCSVSAGEMLFAQGWDALVTGEMFAGGLVGGNEGGTIEDSEAAVGVDGNAFIGGLVGMNLGGTITGSFVTDADYGEMPSSAAQSSFSPQVRGAFCVGGLAGLNLNGVVEDDSYSAVDVEGDEVVGGLVGLNGIPELLELLLPAGNGNGDAATLTEASAAPGHPVIDNSHATGAVRGAREVGGLVGVNINGEILDASAGGEVRGGEMVGGLVGVNLFELDFNGLEIEHGAQASIRGSHAGGGVFGSKDIGGLVGENYNGEISGSFALGNVTGSPDNGVDFDVSNGELELAGVYIGGLAGYNHGGTITGGSYAAGKVTGICCVGGLVGENVEGLIVASYATGDVEGDELVGGLVGMNEGGLIGVSCAAGNVEGFFAVGALVGSNSCGDLLQETNIGELVSLIFLCYSTGDVRGVVEVGGLAGRNANNAIISDCYSRGNVTVEQSAIEEAGIEEINGWESFGGFCGYNSATIKHSYSTGSVSCSDAGNAVSTQDAITDKGFVGYNDGGTYANNFFDTQTSNQSFGAGAEGKDTAEMNDYFTFFDAGWDFIGEVENGEEELWGIDETGTDNDGYPFFDWQNLSHRVFARVETESVERVAATSASFSGELVHPGYATPTQYGFCWNTTGNPTLDDELIEVDEYQIMAGGNGFSRRIHGLDPKTRYYMRAYATNSTGTSYGEVQEFTTTNRIQGKINEAIWEAEDEGDDDLYGREPVLIGPGEYSASSEGYPYCGITIPAGADGLVLKSTDGWMSTWIDAECEYVAITIEAHDVTVEGFLIVNFVEAGVRVFGDRAVVADNVVNEPCMELAIKRKSPPLAIAVHGAEGAIVAGNALLNCHAGILIGAGAHGTRIANNAISENYAGITDTLFAGTSGGAEIAIDLPSPPSDTRAVHNNIFGNVYGAWWDEGVNAVSEINGGDFALHATHNWWGHASGPDDGGPGEAALTEGPDGGGDTVIGNVLFHPWLTERVVGGGSYDEKTAREPREDIPYALHVTKGAEDSGEVFATRLYGNTAGVAFKGPGEGEYIHLFVDKVTGDITEVILKIGYREPVIKTVYWFDDTAENEEHWDWVAVELQEWNPTPLPAQFAGYDGYVRITLDDESSPSLDQFSGKVFAIGFGEDGPKRISGGGSDCFIATAAFGSPDSPQVRTLRAFRDEYLLGSAFGRRFVNAYYRHSPRLAAVVAERPVFRGLTALALLPVSGVAYLMLSGYGTAIAWALMAGLLVLLLAKRKQGATHARAALVVAAALMLGGLSGAYGAPANIFERAPGERMTVASPTTEIIGEDSAAFDILYSYARKPLELRMEDGEDYDLVKRQHQLQATLTYGISDELQVSLRTPYAMKQRSEFDDVDTRGFGDTVLSAKYRLPWQIEDVRFAVAPHYRFNTGRRGAFMSGEGPAAGVRLISDMEVNGHLRTTFNVGYEYRSRESLVQVDIEHSMLYGAGLVFAVPETELHLTGEIFGRSERLLRSRHSPLEALASAGYDLGNGISLTAGMGRGLSKGYGASGWRFFSGLRVGF